MLNGLDIPATAVRYNQQGHKELCMKGGIYCRQRCFLCGKNLRDDSRRRGCFCPDHPQVAATKRFFVRFPPDIFRNFTSYAEAERFLIGLRYKTDEGSFDSRDYRVSRPMGFANLADKYLAVKRVGVSASHYRNLSRYMQRAKDAWGLTNIKDLGYAEIEDLLVSQSGLSTKTRSNMKSCLHDFWSWVGKRRLIPKPMLPDFPETPFELGWRKIIDKATQEAIIEEVRRLTWDLNPKVWLGIRWLSIYIEMRPGELLKILEDHIDLGLGGFIIPHPKEKRPKFIRLLDEDLDAIRSMPRGLPHLRFFRHGTAVRKGCRPGQSFGEKYLYKWWKRACTNLGVEGVDLYGGTRHSTATALQDRFSPEEIRRNGTRHSSKAFDRYLQARADGALEMAKASTQLTGGAKVVSIEDRLLGGR